MKLYPLFCKDCKHSQPEPGASWNLKCKNPIVNSKDPWALSYNGVAAGSSCNDERGRRWNAPCGIKGKLWEAK